MNPKPKNAFYAQSGGVTAVINATAAAVIETVRQHPDKIPSLYAGQNGILGALNENLFDTAQISAQDLAKLADSPSGVFGSCRYKLKDLNQHKNHYERLIEVFRAYDIGYFFYNGGNDSADTCQKIGQFSRDLGYDLQAIHLPKTMDNDLPLTDCCPGFGSVAKYTATSILEARLDLAAMAKTSTKVFILEVMGRHAGWTAAAGGLAGESHLLLLPEVIFHPDVFLAEVQNRVARDGFCTIVASEGIQTANGQFYSAHGNIDAFGHTQLGGVAARLADLIQKNLKYKCHYAIADYLMRSARHLVSATDLAQARAVGIAAVNYALAGERDVMVSLVREQDSPYVWRTDTVPLIEVANVERKLPPEFIDSTGFQITDLARRYLQPLIEGESPPPYRLGLPDYVDVNLECEPKKLGEFLG